MVSAHEEGSEADLRHLVDLPFDELPPQNLIRSFGVDYAHLPLSQAGGDLYITRHGWPFVQQLLPVNWYANEWYARHGERLPASTGTVYKVATRPVQDRSIDVVVKFSRVGQEVPLEVATTFPEGVSHDDIANARFNGPFEEFGLVHDMRRGEYGPPGGFAPAQRPLAIYAPSRQFELWQLGRSEGRFVSHQRHLQKGGEAGGEPNAIELDIKRDYVLVYSWIKGYSAAQYHEKGLLDVDALESLTGRVNAELAARGFRVLDSKPQHFILRCSGRTGDLIKRQGKLVYGVVDFELLERTSAYHQEFRKSRRASYWTMQKSREDAELVTRPRALELTPVNIMGVDYIYGSAPNGGKLWVVGNDPELFDYFLPDRWRRTPALRLSLINEVYRTRTRDNIYVVYRRSRVGEKPHVDPMYEHGRQVLAHGINSPFEEVAIARTLRHSGVPTTYLRAVYRTRHRSETVAYLADNSRYESHKHLMLPDDPTEPMLSPSHDYYVIWGLWRGIDPMAGGSQHGVIDVQQARDEQLLTKKQFDDLVEDTRRRMAAIGFTDETVQHTQFLLRFRSDGKSFARQEDGRLDLTFAVDAQRAYEHNLLSKAKYRKLVEAQRKRLLIEGYDPLDLHGDHILLALNPDGEFKRDESGQLEVAHCNFDLIRACK